eukprot:5074765-Pyramimonas_sp.AAC.1
MGPQRSLQEAAQKPRGWQDGAARARGCRAGRANQRPCHPQCNHVPRRRLPIRIGCAARLLCPP